MTFVPEFPRALLREQSHAWNLAGVAVSPGQTAQSVAGLVRSDGGGFWSCSMSDIPLAGNNTIRPGIYRERERVMNLLWRAVRQVCNGGVNNIVVPRNDAFFRPWPDEISQSAVLDVTHSDETLFSDGSAYHQTVIDITCDAADRRATSLSLTINFAGDLIGGESFSIRHETLGWRLYEIGTVDIEDGSGVITFNPPLREAVVDGTPLEFDRPRCTMRLVTPSSMNLTVVPWMVNSASVDFVEGF